MTAEGVAWWFTFGSGFLMGALVTAIACGRLRAVSRFVDRLLDEDEMIYRSPQRSIPLPKDHELWMN